MSKTELIVNTLACVPNSFLSVCGEFGQLMVLDETEEDFLRIVSGKAGELIDKSEFEILITTRVLVEDPAKSFLWPGYVLSSTKIDSGAQGHQQ